MERGRSGLIFGRRCGAGLCPHLLGLCNHAPGIVEHRESGIGERIVRFDSLQTLTILDRLLELPQVVMTQGDGVQSISKALVDCQGLLKLRDGSVQIILSEQLHPLEIVVLLGGHLAECTTRLENAPWLLGFIPGENSRFIS